MDDDLFAAFGDDDDEPQTSRRHVVQEEDPKDGEKKWVFIQFLLIQNTSTKDKVKLGQKWEGKPAKSVWKSWLDTPK